MIAELQIPPAKALDAKMAAALALAHKVVGQAMHQPDMAELLVRLVPPTEALYDKLLAAGYPVQADHVAEALTALRVQRIPGAGEGDEDTAYHEALGILNEADRALTCALVAGDDWRTVGTVPADIYDPAERIPA